MKSCNISDSLPVLTTVVCLQSSSCSVGIGHPESSGVKSAFRGRCVVGWRSHRRVASSQCFLQGSFVVFGQCELVVL